MTRCFVLVYGMDNLVVGLTDDPYKRHWYFYRQNYFELVAQHEIKGIYNCSEY